MNKTITAIKRGVKVAVAEVLRPRQFEAGAKPVVCSHCGSHGFQWHGYGIVGTKYKPMVGGYILECSQCSHLEHFAKKPTEIDPTA
jgi:hypothetical protein